MVCNGNFWQTCVRDEFDAHANANRIQRYSINVTEKYIREWKNVAAYSKIQNTSRASCRIRCKKNIFFPTLEACISRNLFSFPSSQISIKRLLQTLLIIASLTFNQKPLHLKFQNTSSTLYYFEIAYSNEIPSSAFKTIFLSLHKKRKFLRR